MRYKALSSLLLSYNRYQMLDSEYCSLCDTIRSLLFYAFRQKKVLASCLASRTRISLSKSKRCYHVDNIESICYIFLHVLKGEIEPLIVSWTISIALDEKVKSVGLFQGGIDTAQISTLKPGIENEVLVSEALTKLAEFYLFQGRIIRWIVFPYRGEIDFSFYIHKQVLEKSSTPYLNGFPPSLL